jgi:tRNA A37 threonylcarbamoyltransferase TsaD
LFIGGGVSANNLLRKVLKEQKQWNVFIPEKKYSTDNASMICNYARFII